MTGLPASRTYALLLWKANLPIALSQNNWPQKIRTFALNALTAHFRDIREPVDEEDDQSRDRS
jgi:hypothetical protein